MGRISAHEVQKLANRKMGEKYTEEEVHAMVRAETKEDAHTSACSRKILLQQNERSSAEAPAGCFPLHSHMC